MKRPHRCQIIDGKHRIWARCPVCRGRIHSPYCQATRFPSRDCCEARHKALFLSGIQRGLDRPDLPMYDPSYPVWIGVPV